VKASITTTIPVRNGKEFLLQTLESLAKQTKPPDRVVVLDNFSTDSTRQIVEEFKKLRLEFVPNTKELLGVFGNFNRCLDYASETEYLHILHADDCILPKFYEVMTQHLADCNGLGMAWCLDERIDENNRRLSLSGKSDGRVDVLDQDTFLARKAEIGNQAFAATLLKTNYQRSPERFPLDMLILGDMIFWPKFGTHCNKIVTVNLPLAQYRWHGSNETCLRSLSVESLIVDEWRTIQQVEALRGKPPGLLRRMKLKGLLSVRAGIKAKRVRQLGNTSCSQTLAKTARQYTGLPLWLARQFLVELRDLIIFKVLGRPRHPKNVFS